jgi:hypothetical protein
VPKLVTGIFPDCDPQVIEGALKDKPGVVVGRLKVVTKAAPSRETEESAISFMHVAEMQSSNDFSDDMTHGTGMISDSGGTAVPGMGAGGTKPSLRDFRHGSAADYLVGFAIPSDQVDNYNDAVEDGRCVVAYEASDDEVDKVAGAFKAAGVRNVRAFSAS